MKFITLVTLLAASLGWADTVSFTTTAQAPMQSGGQPFDLFVHGFDSSQGTLESVSWAFSDFQQYYGGYNDTYQTPGETFTFSTTEGDASAVLGLNAWNTQQRDGVTDGMHQISQGGEIGNNFIDAIGLAPSVAPFIGQGLVDVPVTPFMSATSPVVDGDAAVFSGMVWITDSASLTVSYTYDPAVQAESGGWQEVPEPHYRGIGLVLAAVFSIKLLRERRAKP